MKRIMLVRLTRFRLWRPLLVAAMAAQFSPESANCQSSEGSSIVGGALLPAAEGEDETPPSPPPALKPIQTTPEAPQEPPPSLEPRLSEEGVEEEIPVLRRRETPPPRLTLPPAARSDRPIERTEDARVIIEHRPAGGEFRSGEPAGGLLSAGDSMRWKYTNDLEWRILTAFDSTQVEIQAHHYKIGGNFFHSYREGSQRVQVPSRKEAWVRENDPQALLPDQKSLKLFVQVDAGAPKAPPPDGNCAVWEGGKLLLSDRVSGEIDSVVGGRIKNLQVESLTPGLIFGLQAPSQVSLYAVKIDFEQEIFANLGREKGRSDSEFQKANQLLQVADTPARVEWAQGRVSYEQARSQYLEEQRQYYEMFLRGELDSISLIRSQHPMPHVQFARIVHRHENLEVTAGLFSDHLGKILVPANAFLWINEARPVAGTPFDLEIVDRSDPPFVGYDTRFRADGSQLVVEEKAAGSSNWLRRDIAFDTYTYAAFRPPQPGVPPEYLVDLTLDMTGGLKRLDQEMIVNGRIGTLRLTANDFRIDLNPELLISPVPMSDLHRNILIGPLDLRGWIFGRRTKIHQAFMKVRMIPDVVLDPFEEMVDEIALKAYRIEKEKRARDARFQYTPAKMVLKLSRSVEPGVMLVEISMEDKDSNTVQAARSIAPGVDLIDFLARSVALNREETDLAGFRPLSGTEWRSMTAVGAAQ